MFSKARVMSGNRRWLRKELLLLARQQVVRTSVAITEDLAPRVSPEIQASFSKQEINIVLFDVCAQANIEYQKGIYHVRES